MPPYSDEKKAEHLSRVRGIIIRKANVSIREMQATLASDPKSPLHLSINYIQKLMRKVWGERAYRRNHGTQLWAAAKEDVINELTPHLWKIVQSSKVDMFKILAAGKIVEFTEELGRLAEASGSTAQQAKEISIGVLNVFQEINSPRTMELLQGMAKEVESKHEEAKEIQSATEGSVGTSSVGNASTSTSPTVAEEVPTSKDN